MTEAEIVEIIEDADVDKDGLIDYHEFYQMMHSVSNWYNSNINEKSFFISIYK